jgi:hypothetical protein
VYPCGHLCICLSCSKQINRCQICFAEVLDFVPNYTVGNALNLEYKIFKPDPEINTNNPNNNPNNNPDNNPDNNQNDIYQNERIYNNAHSCVGVSAFLLLMALIGIIVTAIFGIYDKRIVSDTCWNTCKTSMKSCETKYNNYDSYDVKCYWRAEIETNLDNKSQIPTKITSTQDDGYVTTTYFDYTNITYAYDHRNRVCESTPTTQSCYYKADDPTNTLTLYEDDLSINTGYILLLILIIFVFLITFWIFLANVVYIIKYKMNEYEKNKNNVEEGNIEDGNIEEGRIEENDNMEMNKV